MRPSLTRHLQSPVAGPGCVFLAFAVTYLTWPLLEPTPMALFYAAVVAAALLGGVEGGLLAVALSTVSAYYAFLPPYWGFGTEPKQLVIISVFLSIASVFVMLIARQRRATGREKEQRRWFSATLSSVGDAVIATDTGGRIAFMNDAAERLTGWTAEEAAGRELCEVFAIFKEGTREPTDSPVKKALETGHIVGLANHTVLISKDGTETAIEDSAAPIRDDEGTLRGVILVFRDASEKRRAELATEEAQRQTTNVLESINDGFLAMDAEFRHTYANEAALRLVGLKPEEVLGRTHWEAFPATVGSQVEANYRRAATERVTVEFENYYEPLQGWYAIKVSPAREGGVVVYFSDITERKRAVGALAASEERFRAAVRAVSGILWTNNAAGEMVGEQPGWAALTGQSPEEYQGFGWAQAVHPDDARPTIVAWNEAVRGRKTFVFEHRLRRHDGQWRRFAIRAIPVLRGDGEIAEWVGVHADVTDQRAAELATARSEGRFRALVTATSDVVFRMGPDWSEMQPLDGRGLVAGNESPIRDWMQRNIPAFEHDRVRGAIQEAVAGKQTFELEHQVNRPDGTLAWTSSRAVPILDAGGDVAEWFGTASDVTRRKEAEEASRRRSRQLQRLADVATRINAAHDVESVVRVVTEEARHLVGARRSATSIAVSPHQPEPLSVISTEEQPPHEPENIAFGAKDLYEAVTAENQPVRIAQSELEHDPRWRTLQKVALVKPVENGWLAAPLVARGGQPLGLLQLADKTEGGFTEDDEAILVQLSRLASIAVENARLYEELRGNDRRKDEFLAMLAHELRNPLSAIGNAVMLTTKGGLQEHVEWSMDVITRQIKHLTRLIDDLLDVSRISRGKIELKRDSLDLTPILDSAVLTARPLIEERKHTLDVAVDRGNLWASVDPTRLEQVVVNLLNNAAKYGENGGHIRLSAGTEGGEVVIAVKDRGFGIAPDKLPQMFELFAQGDRSLARSEGGLGIGLTVVKKLVEMHGGNITARSEGPGKGSEFTVRLPRATRPAAPTPERGDPSRGARKPARILVVDDNVDTARGMAKLLKLLGHEVAVAYSGPEGIEAARGHRPEFVLLDIGLPGMDGYEVAARLRREECCGHAVIIAVSGYGQDDDRRRSKEAGFDHHLIKPLDHDALFSLLSAGPDGRG